VLQPRPNATRIPGAFGNVGTSHNFLKESTLHTWTVSIASTAAMVTPEAARCLIMLTFLIGIAIGQGAFDRRAERKADR